MKDKIIRRAAVAMAIAEIEIQEIILIALLDFLETRYRFAIKNGMFKERISF
jgi:hypothetical protein